MAVGLGHSQADVTLILSQRPVRVCSLDSWLSCLWQLALLETVCSSLWAPPSKLLISSPNTLHLLSILSKSVPSTIPRPTERLSGPHPSPLQGRQCTRPRKPSRLILFPGWVKLDQAVLMLLEAQHSSRLTSVFNTRLQVASLPCWSQHTPPMRKWRRRETPDLITTYELFCVDVLWVANS